MPEAVVTLAAIAEMRPGKTGVRMIVHSVNYRNSRSSRDSDDRRTDERVDVMEMDDIGALRLQHLRKTPHARTRVAKADHGIDLIHSAGD